MITTKRALNIDRLSDKLSQLWRGPGESGEGFYSLYFNVGNGIGIKLLRDRYNTKYEMQHSIHWARAKEETRLLHHAFKSGLTPKSYGTMALQVYGDWHAAIVMQHLKGENFALWEHPSYGALEKESMCEALRITLLRRTGIDHGDLEDRNVIVWDKPKDLRFWILDFSPKHVYTWGNVKEAKKMADRWEKEYLDKQRKKDYNRG